MRPASSQLKYPFQKMEGKRSKFPAKKDLRLNFKMQMTEYCLAISHRTSHHHKMDSIVPRWSRELEVNFHKKRSDHIETNDPREFADPLHFQVPSVELPSQVLGPFAWIRFMCVSHVHIQ